ncbi:MAG: hypothetical protein M3O20_04265 [Acidobacteriota bacterium]|nr:hypothetical protein [Acidobacteriota bacterium]
MQRPPGEFWNSSQFTLAAKLMTAVWLWPLKEAVTVTFWLLLTDPELAKKVAPLWPTGTVTLEGTESNPLLVAKETVAAPLAAELSVTVQVVDRLLANAEGVQASELSCAAAAAAAVTVKVFETPLRVAVSRAAWLEVTTATVALKVALLCPAPIFTLDGTLTLVLLLASVTLTALVGAAPRVTVQSEAPGPVTLAGAQVRLVG